MDAWIKTGSCRKRQTSVTSVIDILSTSGDSFYRDNSKDVSGCGESSGSKANEEGKNLYL